MPSRAARSTTFRAALASALLALAAQNAAAGNFSVSPVRIYMAPNDRAIAVTVVNEGGTDVALQTELFSWTQKPDGTDNLVPTEDLIVAPPIMKLAPGARQVIRLARIVAADPKRQLTYRLVVREVPEATAPKDSKGIVLQMPIALAMSMPVFITPPSAQRDVRCGVARMDGQTFNAVCQNIGTAYGQIRSIVLARGAQELAKFEGGTYLLPGARRSMSVKAEAAVAPGPAVARVQFDDGHVTEMPLDLP